MIKDSFDVEAVRLTLHDTLLSLRKGISPHYETHGAILDLKGDLVSVSGLNPLHYASFETCVKSLKRYLSPKINEVFVTNDPYSGNTRLCDLMLIQGAFGNQQANELRYFVALQISIPQLINKKWEKMFTSVEEEGYRIPPSPLDQAGFVNPAMIDYISQSGFPKAKLLSLLGDAKIALKKASIDLTHREVFFGREKFQSSIESLRKYSEERMRKALHEIPDGEYDSHDFIDNDGISPNPIRIQCRLMVQGENILVNFSGSGKQTLGPFNCNYAMTFSACFSSLLSLVRGSIPINSGAFKSFSVEAQEGTVVNSTYPHPLLGGYYETSKRICDAIRSALSKALPHEIPSMNGGSSSTCIMKFLGSGKGPEGTIYIETLGTGSGGSYLRMGAGALKTEFNNYPAMSIEELEQAYPIQIVQNSLRDAMGGDGKNPGGRGITRGYKFLEPALLILLGDRKNFKIQGYFGGTSGQHGSTIIFKSGEKKKIYNEKAFVQVEKGDTLFISTPSGAGWGKAEELNPEL